MNFFGIGKNINCPTSSSENAIFVGGKGILTCENLQLYNEAMAVLILSFPSFSRPRIAVTVRITRPLFLNDFLEFLSPGKHKEQKRFDAL